MAAPGETMTRLIMAQGRRPRVAVVGGSTVGGMVASALLEQFGCAAVVTPTGESVLALLGREEPVDLALVDLSLPDMDGIVAVELIRALGARGALPVIALTSDGSEAAAPRARAVGFAETVVKPYSPRELYGAMHRALAEARRETPADARA